MSWDNLKTGAVGQVYDGEWRDPPPWATRIPAAIKRAKEELGDADYVIVQRQQLGTDTIVVALTATEAALAEAHWDLWTLMPLNPLQDENERYPPELIVFTEKVEQIDN